MNKLKNDKFFLKSKNDYSRIFSMIFWGNCYYIIPIVDNVIWISLLDMKLLLLFWGLEAFLISSKKVSLYSTVYLSKLGAVKLLIYPSSSVKEMTLPKMSIFFKEPPFFSFAIENLLSNLLKTCIYGNLNGFGTDVSVHFTQKKAFFPLVIYSFLDF